MSDSITHCFMTAVGLLLQVMVAEASPFECIWAYVIPVMKSEGTDCRTDHVPSANLGVMK